MFMIWRNLAREGNAGDWNAGQLHVTRKMRKTPTLTLPRSTRGGEYVNMRLPQVEMRGA